MIVPLTAYMLTPAETRQAVLDALSVGPLHYTALRRTLHARWTKLPKHGLDDALEELLKHKRIELVRNEQSVTYGRGRRQLLTSTRPHSRTGCEC